MATNTTFKSNTDKAAKPMAILVADDHFANRLLTQILLQREGHDITLADHGKDAVRACTAQVFDLLLLDIQMPIMNGFQALKWIKTLSNGNEATPAYALTAHTHPSEIKTILSKGFDAVLLKPFRVSDMMRQLDRPYKYSADRSSVIIETPDASPKFYATAIDMPLLEVQTLDILLGAIGPGRMCTVLAAYWQDAKKLMMDIKATRITGQIGVEIELMELRKTAHGLKGASANVGLLKASRLSAHLQNAPIEDIPYLVETLERTLQDSQSAIRDYCGLTGNVLRPKLQAAS